MVVFCATKFREELPLRRISPRYSPSPDAPEQIVPEQIVPEQTDRTDDADASLLDTGFDFPYPWTPIFWTLCPGSRPGESREVRPCGRFIAGGPLP